MPVIARDAVASDHLVYAWPFPIGPEDCEVSCAEDELVVMCPAWLVGDRLGPGRHRWRSPDPTRPVGAYFVLTAPVEVSFDMITQFVLPANGQPVRLRASGSLQVRCMDPGLLVAQFVGLPFDSVNEGVLRSVSRSLERMLARLLTRRVVMAGTPHAVTDPSMLQNIIDELVAYNPTAGAVFGVELVRFGHLAIMADDGRGPWQHMHASNGVSPRAQTPDLLETTRAPRPPTNAGIEQPRATPSTPVPQPRPQGFPQSEVSGEIRIGSASGEIGGNRGAVSSSSASGGAASGEIGGNRGAVTSAAGGAASGEIGGNRGAVSSSSASGGAASGEIGARAKSSENGSGAVTGEIGGGAVSGEIGGKANKPITSPGHKPASATVQTGVVPPPIPLPASFDSANQRPKLDPNRVINSPVPTAPQRRAGSVEVPQSTDEITQPGIDIVRTPLPGSLNAAMAQGTPAPEKPPVDSRGSIMGIGMAPIGAAGVASGEITKKIAPGGRVLVPGPNGLMQSATVRQLLQGYYELEVGGSGETIWVPINGVVPET